MIRIQEAEPISTWRGFKFMNDTKMARDGKFPDVSLWSYDRAMKVYHSKHGQNYGTSW